MLGGAVLQNWCAAAACLAAFGCGACLSRPLLQVQRTRKARQATARLVQSGDERFALARGGLGARVILLAVRLSDSAALARKRPFMRLRTAAKIPPKLMRDIQQAGLQGQITQAGITQARVRLAVGGAAGGACIGWAFSLELSLLFCLAGLVVGWLAVPRAIRERKLCRSEELERHLPEMLEVLSLGLRSGLSFERALDAYIRHFDTLLAWSFASAKHQWTLGLLSRDEALKRLSESYDSALFSRVVGNISRSLRFGSSLAESLEDAACQARATYRARKEEQVAKAPVKMMLPVGALMLPAMLLLVLGPVLLDLMQGM